MSPERRIGVTSLVHEKSPCSVLVSREDGCWVASQQLLVLRIVVLVSGHVLAAAERDSL